MIWISLSLISSLRILTVLAFGFTLSKQKLQMLPSPSVFISSPFKKSESEFQVANYLCISYRTICQCVNNLEQAKKPENRLFKHERVRGFAPLLKPWKGFVLLLHHTRSVSRGTRIRTEIKRSQSVRASHCTIPR